VVDAVTPDEPDLVAILVGEDSSTVDLLLVDPALTMEGFRQLGGVHQRGDRASGTRLTGNVISVAFEVIKCLRWSPPPKG
jgi:hypothetical protein